MQYFFIIFTPTPFPNPSHTQHHLLFKGILSSVCAAHRFLGLGAQKSLSFSIVNVKLHFRKSLWPAVGQHIGCYL